MSEINFKALHPQIVLVQLEDSASLAEAMARFQEYYESPFDDIRGKVFTMGQLWAKGSRSNLGINTYLGGNNYDPDWAGYNWPSHVLEPFLRGLFDPLTSYEQDIVNALKYRTDRFYVIGTSLDYREALAHELCHAMYYISEGYKKEIDKVLALMDLTKVYRVLINMGYCEEVLADEAQAYLIADGKWFIKEFRLEDEIEPRLLARLKRIKTKYFKELKGVK